MLENVCGIQNKMKENSSGFYLNFSMFYFFIIKKLNVTLYSNKKCAINPAMETKVFSKSLFNTTKKNKKNRESFSKQNLRIDDNLRVNISFCFLSQHLRDFIHIKT